jgi:hypothetical protein
VLVPPGLCWFQLASCVGRPLLSERAMTRGAAVSAGRGAGGGGKADAWADAPVPAEAGSAELKLCGP